MYKARRVLASVAFLPVTLAPAFSNLVIVNHFSFLPSLAFCSLLFLGTQHSLCLECLSFTSSYLS